MRKSKHARPRAARGQAMVEYSAITALLVGVGGLTMMAVPMGTGGPLFKQFWDALNLFYDSIYYVLQCSVP